MTSRKAGVESRRAIDNPTIDRSEVNQLIDNIKIQPGLTKSKKFEIERDRAFIMLCYITSARITEVLNLTRSNFIFDKPDSTNYWITKMLNQKNSNLKQKNIPIPKADSFSEPIRNYVEKYVKQPKHYLFFHIEKRNGTPYKAKKNIYRDYALYKHSKKLNKKVRVGTERRLVMKKGQLSILRNKPMTRQTAWLIIKNRCGNQYWAHIFRHYRLSHLAERLTDRQLIGISGHRSASNLEHYVRLNPSAYEGDIIPVD